MNATATPARTGTRDVLRALRQPKVLAMLLLGFSSGLPLYLVGNTMGYWMRENGSELSAIGFLSWVGLAYTLKFLWAPIIDKTDVPILGRLGHRRGIDADFLGARLDEPGGILQVANATTHREGHEDLFRDAADHFEHDRAAFVAGTDVEED